MNRFFAGVVDKYAPKMTDHVISGNINDQFKLIPEWLDSILKSSILSLNPILGLKYEGYRRCTPKEEFINLYGSSIKNNASLVCDITTSTVMMIELLFSYNGELITRPLMLPYALDGNIMMISGTKYHVVPILTDTVISPNPSKDSVFVRLLKDKITVMAKRHNIVINNVTRTTNIIFAPILRNIASNDIKKGFITTLTLFTLGKYGFRQTLLKYCHDDRVIITNQNITEDLVKSYDVYESYYNHNIAIPRGIIEANYRPHSVKFLIHKELKNKHIAERIVCDLLYTLDMVVYFEKDIVNIHKMDINNELYFWRLMLGRMSHKPTQSVESMMSNVNEHYSYFEGYVDSLIKDKLKENNIIVNDLYDLLMYVSQYYESITSNSKEIRTDLSSSYIDVLYYILYNTIYGFNRAVLKLNKRCSKKTSISSKEIDKILKEELGTRRIFNLIKSSNRSLALLLLDTVNDIKFPKVTSVLEDQARGDGVVQSKTEGRAFPEELHELKAQDLVLGSLLFLTKKAPSPRFRINPFINYNIFTGRISIPHDIQKSINKLEKMLNGKISQELMGDLGIETNTVIDLIEDEI